MKSKLKIILISVFSVTALLFGGVIYYVSQKVNSEEIRQLTIKQIQNTFPSAKVELGKFDLSLGARIKLTADNLNISYPSKGKSYNMLSVKDLNVKVPIWSILTGGGTIDVNLDSPQVGYYELQNGTNWSLSTKGGSKKVVETTKSKKADQAKTKGAEKVSANQLVIPAFIANSSVNLRLKNILLDYALKPNTNGTVEINKFLVTNLGLKSKAAFELDSKIILGQKKASDVSFRSLIIGEFSLNEFLKNNKIDSNIVLKISDVLLKGSNLKIPLMKNDIAFQMNGGNIKGSVKTNFEKSSLGFDYSLGGSKILVSNLKSDIKLNDLLNIANDPSLPVSAKNAALSLGGGVTINNNLITPNLSIEMKDPLSVTHQGLNADVTMNGSVKGSKTNLKVSTKVLEGIIDLIVATDFNLNSKKPVQSRLKNTTVNVDMSSVNITTKMLQEIIYAKSDEPKATSNDKTAESTTKTQKAKAQKGTAFVLPNAKINLNWNKVKVGTEETKGLIKVNVKNNIIKTNKYTINFGKGTIKGNESLILGKTSTKGSFDLSLNNIQFESFQAMLPPQVTEIKGNFSGKLKGKFYSGEKVTYDVSTNLKASNGDLKGIDVNEYVQKVYGLVEKLSFLKGKMPKKDVKVDGNFEIFELDGRFKQNHFDLKKVNFVGVNKKIMMKGSGNVYPLPSKREGKVYIDFKDQLGLSKVMKKNVGTETMPLLFKGSGYALSPDYGFTAKKLAKSAYKSKGKKQVKKAVNKLKKKIFKTDDKKKVEDKIKNEAKKLFKGFF